MQITSPADKFASMKANPDNRAATLKSVDLDGTWNVDGVRWGFDETGPDRTQWEPRYKDLQVNPKDIKDVYICIEPFPPEWIAGHGEAVLEFNKPITNSDGEQDNRLVVSVEAWKPVGSEYGLTKGFGKNFGIVHQLGSWGDRVQRQARKEGRPMMLYKVALTQEQKEKFARNALAEATADHTGEWYHTLTNSCFSSQVVALNEVLPEEQQINRWTKLLGWPRLSATIPATAGVVLERYGLRTEDPPIEIMPDARLHERRPVEPGPIGRASQKAWWGPTCRLAGFAAGAGLGGQLAGWPGALAGGLATGWLAGVAADQTRVLNSTVKTEPDQFYPAHVKKQLGI